MNKEQLGYVEDFGLLFEGFGFPRMVGRALGMLLISDPPDRSAEELADLLQTSRGSISSATRTLVQIGLVQRMGRPGERRDYFRVKPDAWHELMRRELESVAAFREMAERRLSFVDSGSPDARRPRAVGERYGGKAMRAVIETEGLTKFYGRSRGIWFVDLEVNEGEVFGFLGPNGAGKTTTIRVLLYFPRPELRAAEPRGDLPELLRPRRRRAAMSAAEEARGDPAPRHARAPRRARAPLAAEERRYLGPVSGALERHHRGIVPVLRGDLRTLNELIESYPPEMRELFGIGEGKDLDTIEGFSFSASWHRWRSPFSRYSPRRALSPGPKNAAR